MKSNYYSLIENSLKRKKILKMIDLILPTDHIQWLIRDSKHQRINRQQGS
jgi:hypothetical protein